MDRILIVKALVCFLNSVFFIFGCYLMYCGVCFSSDEDYVNYSLLVPSKYPMPVLYYFMFGVTLLGVVFSAVSILGWTSTISHSKLLYSFYIFSLSILLIAEVAGLISASATPDILGLEIDKEELQDSFQRFYAVPGKEGFTAAIDYIQTNAGCCGAIGGKDYVASWWKLREYGPEDLVVPLSCCVRETGHQQDGDISPHLDPMPYNLSLCQHEDLEVHGTARHTQGCAGILTNWLHDGIREVVYTSVAAILYEICLLLASICAAMQIFAKSAT